MSGSLSGLRNRSTDKLKRWINTVQTYLPGRFFLSHRTSKKSKSKPTVKYNQLSCLEEKNKNANLDVIMGSLRKDIFELMDNIPTNRSPVTILFKLNSLDTNIRETCNIQEYWATHPNSGRENLKAHEKYVIKLIDDIIDDVYEAAELISALYVKNKPKERLVSSILSVLDILKSEVSNMINVLISTFDAQMIPKKNPLYETPAPYSKEDRIYTVYVKTEPPLDDKEKSTNKVQRSISAPICQLKKNSNFSFHSAPLRSQKGNSKYSSQSDPSSSSLSENISLDPSKSSSEADTTEDSSITNITQNSSRTQSGKTSQPTETEDESDYQSCDSDCGSRWTSSLFRGGRGDDIIKPVNYCFKSPKMIVLHPDGLKGDSMSNVTYVHTNENSAFLSIQTMMSNDEKDNTKPPQTSLKTKKNSEYLTPISKPFNTKNIKKINSECNENDKYVVKKKVLKKRNKKSKERKNINEPVHDRRYENNILESKRRPHFTKSRPVINVIGEKLNNQFSEEMLEKCFEELNRKNSNFVRYKTMAFDEMNINKTNAHLTTSLSSVGTVDNERDLLVEDKNPTSYRLNDGYKCVTIPIRSGIIGVTLKKLPNKEMLLKPKSYEVHPQLIHCMRCQQDNTGFSDKAPGSLPYCDCYSNVHYNAIK